MPLQVLPMMGSKGRDTSRTEWSVNSNHKVRNTPEPGYAWDLGLPQTRVYPRPKYSRAPGLLYLWHSNLSWVTEPTDKPHDWC